MPLLIVLAGLLAYHNSFTGPFIFDDVRSIRDNPHIRRLWPLTAPLRGTSRPLTQWTFAVNYALGGDEVAGYHAVNLAIHLAAALVLYGLIWRTLAGNGAAATRARGLAAAAAALWVAHPLNTESVTYIVQRGESLMGLCCLLTLYCAARRDGVGWQLAAVAACAAGMATKPVMATAPLLVWAYDRWWRAGSWRGALRQRWPMYAGLAATWLLLPGLLALGRGDWVTSAGLNANCHTPLEFARSQPGVVLHYLRLAFWPAGLCLDYGWPVATGWRAVLPGALIVGGLAAATAWAWRGGAGFLGAAFFLLLLPTASVVPLLDLAAEHRMYLPLAVVIVGVVLAADRWLRRWPDAVGVALVLVAAGALAGRTIIRNEDYQSDVAIWRQTVEQRPGNARAHANLGGALLAAGRTDDAIRAYKRAVELEIPFAEPYNILGNIFSGRGDYERAIPFYRAAVLLRADFGEAHFNWGVALEAQGKLAEAREHYAVAARLLPDSAVVKQRLDRARVR